MVDKWSFQVENLEVNGIGGLSEVIQRTRFCSLNLGFGKGDHGSGSTSLSAAASTTRTLDTIYAILCLYLNFTSHMLLILCSIRSLLCS